MTHIMSTIVFASVDLVCFLQGSVLLLYGLINFSYKVEVVRGENYYALEAQQAPVAIGGYYYYPEAYAKIILIGLALIITGFLMRSWRKSF